MKLETVKIQRGDGYVIINKSDLKQDDKIFGVKQEKKKQVKKPKSKEV